MLEIQPVAIVIFAHFEGIVGFGWSQRVVRMEKLVLKYPNFGLVLSNLVHNLCHNCATPFGTLSLLATPEKWGANHIKVKNFGNKIWTLILLGGNEWHTVPYKLETKSEHSQQTVHKQI